MIGLLILGIGLAHAHGGENHGHSPADVGTNAGDPARTVLSSALLDGVVTVPTVAGTAVEASLLLADHGTSAPIAGATATLSLAGPGAVHADLGGAGPAGAYHGTLLLPALGTYAGSLTVRLPAPDGGGDVVNELLSVPSLVVSPARTGGAPTLLPRAGAPHVLALLGIGAAGIVVGWVLGRRKGTGMAGGLLLAGTLALAGRQVWAHGGETHGEAPAAARLAVGSSLTIAMERQFLVGLRTTRAERASFEARFPVLGRFVARPGEAATVGAPVDGVLRQAKGTARFPAPGTQVRAGQVLAVIEETPGSADRAALAEARESAATGVAEARAALTLAERDVAALDRLGEGISDRERLARGGARDVARAALAEAEARRTALTVRGIPVTAPVSGRLGPVRVRPGEAVHAGEPLFRVVDAQGVWVEVRVPEGDAASVLPGATARITGPGRAGIAPDEHDASTLLATLLDAGQEVDPTTGTVAMTLVVDAGGETHATPRVLPGMSATVWLGRGGVRPALVVPVAAVIESEGVPLAFVKTGPETFEVRTVSLGGRDGRNVEVLEGIAEGERVVVTGAGTLRIIAGR